MTTVLYRAFDANDDLLYIGITRRLDKRIDAHQSTSAWGRSAARWSAESFPTRAAAEEAEALAIAAEVPRHNVTFSSNKRFRVGEEASAPYLRALVQRMQEVGASQTSLAAATGIKQPTLSRKFDGTRNFYFGEMLAICDALEITLEELAHRAEANAKDAA